MARWKFIPGEVPGRQQQSDTLYVDMLKDYLEKDPGPARIEAKVKPSTLYAGLKKALKEHPELSGIEVMTRNQGKDVWIRLS